MIKYLYSGFYKEPFFTKHIIPFGSDDFKDHDEVNYKHDLFVKRYEELGEFDESDEPMMVYSDFWDEKDEMVYNDFWEALGLYNYHYEPIFFRPEVALECDLIPFTYKGTNLLAFGACGMDLSPRLEAYQVLSSGTIDPDSVFLSDYKKPESYFRSLVGRRTMDKMVKILGLPE